MAIFGSLTAGSPEGSSGRASRNKVLADSADDPDDANKTAELTETISL